jgi:hypothetical protein
VRKCCERKSYPVKMQLNRCMHFLYAVQQGFGNTIPGVETSQWGYYMWAEQKSLV